MQGVSTPLAVDAAKGEGQMGLERPVISRAISLA